MFWITKNIDLIIIGVSGWFAGITLAQFNERLQTAVLVLTLIGLLIRMIKRKKV